MASIEVSDLQGIAYGGLINQDVMQKIWDISNFPLPLTDRIGTDTHANPLAEWTVDALAAPSSTNKYYDSQATTSVASEALGTRRGNYTQTSVKVVKVGTLAQAADTIGFADALAYQVMQRQRELRRDVEAQMLTPLASVKEVAGTTAAQSAGLGAWIVNGQDNSSTPGGWNSSTGIVDARTGQADATDGALSEADIRSAAKTAYAAGGEVSVLMSTPGAIEGLSKYLFAATTIAALRSDVSEKMSGVTATGAVKFLVTDFAVLELVPNRLQPVAGTTTAVAVYLLDPSMLRLSYYKGYTVEPLAKTGLFEQRQMSVAYTLKVLNEGAQQGVFNVDQTATAVA